MVTVRCYPFFRVKDDQGETGRILPDSAIEVILKEGITLAEAHMQLREAADDAGRKKAAKMGYQFVESVGWTGVFQTNWHNQ